MHFSVQVENDSGNRLPKSKAELELRESQARLAVGFSVELIDYDEIIGVQHVEKSEPITNSCMGRMCTGIVQEYLESADLICPNATGLVMIFIQDCDLYKFRRIMLSTTIQVVDC